MKIVILFDQMSFLEERAMTYWRVRFIYFFSLFVFFFLSKLLLFSFLLFIIVYYCFCCFFYLLYYDLIYSNSILKELISFAFRLKEKIVYVYVYCVCVCVCVYFIFSLESKQQKIYNLIDLKDRKAKYNNTRKTQFGC